MTEFKKSLQQFYWKMKYGQIPAYIHVPKTGGTYLAQLESDRDPVLYPVKYFGHSYVVTSDLDVNVIYAEHDPESAKKNAIQKAVASNYFVFSTVRNIFDWLLSYAWHAGGWNPNYVDKNHYDYENANKGFDYLVKTIINREDQWPSRKFIHCQLFASDGDLIVDWVNHMTALSADLEALANYKKVRYSQKTRQRVGKTEDYRKHYTPELIDLVYKTWGREMMLFGFDFESVRRDTALLVRKIDTAAKSLIKYSWSKDVLLVNGLEINSANTDAAVDFLKRVNIEKRI